MRTGLINLDCSGVTTENSAFCVFFLIKLGDSVELFRLTGTFLSFIVDIECRFAIAVNFPAGITVPLVCYSDERPTEAVITSVFMGGNVKVSPVRTH